MNFMFSGGRPGWERAVTRDGRPRTSHPCQTYDNQSLFVIAMTVSGTARHTSQVSSVLDQSLWLKSFDRSAFSESCRDTCDGSAVNDSSIAHQY
eukprot:361007-Amphidinium_carterae.1